MRLTQTPRIDGVRTLIDATDGTAAQQRAVMAAAESAAFGLSVAPNLGAYDTSESVVVVVPGT
jgi:hypothetical protein